MVHHSYLLLMASLIRFLSLQIRNETKKIIFINQNNCSCNENIFVNQINLFVISFLISSFNQTPNKSRVHFLPFLNLISSLINMLITDL